MHVTMVVFWLVYFHFSVLFPHRSSAEGSIFLQRKHRSIKAEYVFKHTVNSRSSLECASKCASNASCISNSWTEKSHMCILSGNDATAHGVHNIHLEEAVEWNTMTRLIDLVTNYNGSDGLYTLDFQEAKDFCASIGTTMATPELLLEAKARGQSSCTCGWLSDGTMGLIIHSYWPECTSFDPHGIVYCISRVKANVWCVNQ